MVSRWFWWRSAPRSPCRPLADENGFARRLGQKRKRTKSCVDKRHHLSRPSPEERSARWSIAAQLTAVVIIILLSVYSRRCWYFSLSLSQLHLRYSSITMFCLVGKMWCFHRFYYPISRSLPFNVCTVDFFRSIKLTSGNFCMLHTNERQNFLTNKPPF